MRSGHIRRTSVLWVVHALRTNEDQHIDHNEDNRHPSGSEGWVVVLERKHAATVGAWSTIGLDGAYDQYQCSA